MCGIAGSVNHALSPELLTSDLLHRGPDEQTSVSSGAVSLYHFRLSIVDIACGKQPMSLGDLTIVFNGEIYNHLELRRRFSLKCSSGSDTETILHLFALLGENALQEMDGMFAFAIHNQCTGKILVARDRAGKKPLYYFNDGKILVFASELNALRSQLELQVREDSIARYLRMGYFHKADTPYYNVAELPAGSVLEIDTATIHTEVRKWWDIHRFYLQASADDFDTALSKTDAFLHTAVQRRVESSDLEVGAFLSGGIDSGLITAIAHQYNPALKTFTVSFDGEYDEAPLAKLVAERYNTSHHEIRIGFDHLDRDIENILANYGEPFFDSSAIPSYYVSEAAGKHLTVILNGDGGDELFGGYRRYVPFAKYDFFRQGAAVRAAAAGIVPLMPKPHNKKGKYNFLYRLADLARKKGLDTYLSATIDSFDGYEKNLRTAPLETVESDFRRISESPLTGLKKIMNLDFDNILAGDLLVKMDIATMAHSLEGRSPLLSKELLEYIPTLPDSYRVKGTSTKHLLRTLAEKYLPAPLIHQPKRGFEIPLKKWIDGQLREVIADYILSPNAYSRSYADPAFVRKLWEKKVDVSDEKRAKMIWTFFALDVWYQKSFMRHA